MVDVCGDMGNAILGELMSHYAKTKGIEGYIIVGPVRDLYGISEIEYQVFAKGVFHVVYINKDQVKLIQSSQPSTPAKKEGKVKWPDKSIILIVFHFTGGGSDIEARRLVAHLMQSISNWYVNGGHIW